MKLVIVKIDEKIFEGELKKVEVPALDGDMVIYPGHLTFLSPLKKGVLKYLNEKDEEVELEIEKGFVEVNNNETIIIL